MRLPSYPFRVFFSFSLVMLTGIGMFLTIRGSRSTQHMIQQAAGSCTVTVPSSVAMIDGTGNYPNIKPGDTICLAAGARQNLKIANIHGTAAAPVIIRNTGGKVIITGTALMAGIYLQNSSFLRISGAGVIEQCGAAFPSPQGCGIELSANNKGVWADGGTPLANIEVDHMYIHDTNTAVFGTGFSFQPYNLSTISGIYLHHNYVSNTSKEGFYIGSDPGKPDANDGYIENVEISYNAVVDVGWDGINVKQSKRNTKVHHNVVKHTGYLSAGANHVPEGGIKGAAGTWEVYNNLVIDSYNTGISMGRSPSGVQNKYYNNVIVNTGSFGIEATENSALIYNNTLVNSPIKVSASGTKIYDNIVVGTNANISGGSATNNQTGAVAASGFVNASGNDYHLTAGSPAVNTGGSTFPPFDFDDKPRPQGAKADIGAFEFGESAPTSPQSVSPTSPVSGNISLSLTLFLHGIGKGGDNVNPTALGTMSPGRPQRTVTVDVTDANGNTVTRQGTVSFNSTNGNFQGTANIGTVPPGAYIIKLASPQYLTKTVPGIVTLTAGQAKALPSIALTTGDTTLDNRLNILDYNVILDCYADIGLPKNCTTTGKKENADITDDSFVNQLDYNLFLRELSVQSGDGGTPVPTQSGTTITSALSPTGMIKPNIIFILSDDQPYDSMTAMNYLNSRTDWFKFTQATLNVALCCPSRATILSGKYSHRTNVIDNKTGHLLNESSLIAGAVRAAGYKTGFIGKYLNLYPFGRGNYKPPGWDNWQVFLPQNEGGGGGGYEQFNIVMYENGQTVSYGSSATDYSTDLLAQKAVSFIQTSQQPFFLFVSPWSPHTQYIPAPRHDNSWSGKPMPRFPNFNEADVSDKPNWVKRLPLVNAATMDNNRREMYEMVMSIDDLVKNVITALEQKGALQNTVVIYMTDNGFSHGEHRHTYKLCPYEECVKTPLLVRYPFAAPRLIDKPVANIDIAPTIAEIAGISFPGIDGASLLPLLRNTSASWRTGNLISWRGGNNVDTFWGVRTPEWKYIEYTNGEKELYDLKIDQYELENKAGISTYATKQTELANLLKQLKL